MSEELATTLRAIAAQLESEAAKLTPPAPPSSRAAAHAAADPTKPFNIYGNTVGTYPGDPAYPGYQAGDGWQCQLRVWARVQDHSADSNKLVKEKGLLPRWPDERQAWELD